MLRGLIARLIAQILHAFGIIRQNFFLIVWCFDFRDLFLQDTITQFLSDKGAAGIALCQQFVKAVDMQVNTHVVHLVFHLNRVYIEIISYFLGIRELLRVLVLHITERHFLIHEQFFNHRTHNGYPG